MADPTLPQTSTQGGPNPNSNGWQMSVLDGLPSMGAAVAPQTTGMARAALQAEAYKRAATAQGVDPAMPAFNPSDPVSPAYPKQAGQLSGSDWASLAAANEGGGTALGANDMTGGKQDPAGQLASQVTPGIGDALSNWWSNAPGSPAAQAYDARQKAGAAANSPEGQKYIQQHYGPGLQDQMNADPMGFALKMGKVLDARANGGTKGSVALTTPDGVTQKNDSNTEHTNAVAEMTGMTPQQAHATTQWHEYNPAEWLHATEGMTNKQLGQMWEMQHYLNPTQQALAMSLSIGSKRAQQGGPQSDAEQQYENMLHLGGGLAMPPMTLPTMQPAK